MSSAPTENMKKDIQRKKNGGNNSNTKTPWPSSTWDPNMERPRRREERRVAALRSNFTRLLSQQDAKQEVED